MGPKKGGKKKKDGDQADTGGGAESADQAEWKTMKTEADKLHKATKREEHDFNEFQQQREKLNYFWIVEKKKLDDKRVELRNKDREFQDLEEKHQVEIKIYKQRLKHLLFEQQNEVAIKKTEAEMAIKMAQDDDREAEGDIREDRRTLNIALKEIEFTHEEYIRGLKRDLDRKITMLRHEFERRAGEVQKTYEMRMKKTREGLDKRRKEEIKAIEERKHVMIDHLMAEHQKAFADIKNYYNDITHNNLDLIKSLKEEVKDLESEERRDQVRLQEKMSENKKLSAPLKQMQDDVLRLRAELADYEAEKAEMRRVKAALLVVESSQSSVSWEYETLLQRLLDLKNERDELQKNLRASMYDVKQKSAFRGMLLEKKLAAIHRMQEEREAQLNEVLARANLEPSVLGQIKGHVDDVLQRKNTEARSYQSEIARLQAMQEELNEFAKRKLQDYGLTVAELGYEPVRPGDKMNKTLSKVGYSYIINIG
mmetsp:Transcript_30994/g.44530  ORF Transcript_30994/g.44530 Transcript_30994/m.44530 type:complete len:482 (-) Transcript_30994:228-1673(-)